MKLRKVLRCFNRSVNRRRMRTITKYVPRKYRTVVLRVIVGVVGFLLICMFMTTDQSTTGSGKHDESLFQFEYDTGVDGISESEIENLYDSNAAPKAVAPMQHRIEAKEQTDEKEAELSLNFTEEALLKSEVYEYYTKDELQPWFDKPAPNPSDPGEYGKPYRPSNTDDETKQKIKKGWENHAFNHYVCDRISLHRFIEDKRDRECKERKWRKPVPTTSVIIIFHNEAWCALLRTVHSVLETSPKVALKEIILVDDASTTNDLKQKLDDYIKDLLIITLIRMPERAGLIRARLAGAEAATGDVLTFLDSHCECAPHWLEPLLERIAEDPTRVVCPVIEVIDADTFAMSLTQARAVQRGILGWNLNFNWSPQKHQAGIKTANDMVIQSPTMAGGLFAMNRNYFNYLGSYDKDMLVWGGENIEMSIRIWTCGGTLEIHPCSHVGHVFRKRAPYTHPGGSEVITRNNKRVAEVWLDEYKEQYYKRVPRARRVDAGDLSSRKKLRKDLKCQKFQWYLTNVYPDLYAPPSEDILKSGEWHNMQKKGKYCLDSANPNGKIGVKINMYICHGMGINQEFEYTRQGEIRHNIVNELCLQPDGSSVVTQVCAYPKQPIPSAQKWIITVIGQLKHVSTNKCIEAVDTYVLLQPCNQNLSQRWIIKNVHSINNR